MRYILTVSKIKFTPAQPNETQMCIEDIAHALSMLCRANGHFQTFYSVAQHSLNCANEAKARGYSKRVQLACLLHDASEAYLSDVTRPVKQFLPEYVKMEDKLQSVVWNKWLGNTLTEEEYQQVFEIDDAILDHEFLFFMDEKIFSGKKEIVSSPDFSEHPISEIKQRFLLAFQVLVCN